MSQNNLFSIDSKINSHILTIDGLFAGFSFAGVIEIFTMDTIPFLMTIAAGMLILATLLFALRINIAIRIITSTYNASKQKELETSPHYVLLVNLGRRVELGGILLFWVSLVPISFNTHFSVGIFTSVCLLLGFSAYYKIIQIWKSANKELE